MEEAIGILNQSGKLIQSKSKFTPRKGKITISSEEILFAELQACVKVKSLTKPFITCSSPMKIPQ